MSIVAKCPTCKTYRYGMKILAHGGKCHAFQCEVCKTIFNKKGILNPDQIPLTLDLSPCNGCRGEGKIEAGIPCPDCQPKEK